MCVCALLTFDGLPCIGYYMKKTKFNGRKVVHVNSHLAVMLPYEDPGISLDRKSVETLILLDPAYSGVAVPPATGVPCPGKNRLEQHPTTVHTTQRKNSR